MEFYELIYIVEEKAQERLSALAERYKKINGWNEKEMLQFAVAARLLHLYSPKSLQSLKTKHLQGFSCVMLFFPVPFL